MIEGLAFIGARATWNLAHSATPDAPVVPEIERQRRRPVVRPHVAHAMRRLAELLDPRDGPTAVVH